MGSQICRRDAKKFKSTNSEEEKIKALEAVLNKEANPSILEIYKCSIKGKTKKSNFNLLK